MAHILRPRSSEADRGNPLSAEGDRCQSLGSLGVFQLELLEELAGKCAAAISDLALGTRLEPTMRVLVGGLPPAPELSLAADVGTSLGLDGPALAELDLAARACTTSDLRPQGLDGVPGLEAVAIIVSFLAERWDGAGEPHGLRGEQIPLASRILSPCLALNEAMADGRTSPDAALRRVRARRGAAFDPVVVDTIGCLITSSAAPPEAARWAADDAQFELSLVAA